MNLHAGFPGDAPALTQADIYRQMLPRGWIDGLTLSTDGSDAVNDIGVAAGVARSTVNLVDGAPSTLSRYQRDIEIPASIVKQVDTLWAPANYDGSGASGGAPTGGKSASAISNTTWHAFGIGGRGMHDDVLFHDSATQSSVLAALPGGYTAYRRIGSVVRAGATNLAFLQNGDLFELVVPLLDENNTAITTTSTTITLESVPNGIVVRALMNVVGTVTNGSSSIWISPLDVTHATPTATATAAPGGSSYSQTSIAGSPLAGTGGRTECRTNTLRQVRAASSAALNIGVTSVGWWDQRDRNA